MCLGTVRKVPGSILGTAVRRVEDPELLTGQATFVDDLALGDALHLTFVRSPSAHARVVSIDTADAAAMPDVVAVYTAADLDLPLFEGLMVVNAACARPPLATDKVRFVGDPVAVVVSTTRGAGLDASEQVVVEYDDLEAVVDAEAALRPGAPLQFESLGT